MEAFASAATWAEFDGLGTAWRELEIASWVVWSLFVFAFGASLGSFMNVVAWRLPRGGSVVSPPSRCPTCAGRLTWRENLPVIGWILLRGRCRFCGVRIGVQYLLTELLLGGLFVAAFLVLYLPDASGWWASGTGGWWTDRGVSGSWPGLLVVLSMFSLLLPITLIDARTFLIPLSLTVWITAIAAGLWTVQALVPVPWRVPLDSPPVPLAMVPTTAAGAAFGGMFGVGVLVVLLRWRLLLPSFADYDDHVEQGETLGDYPHARREALRELLHLSPILAGAGIGWAVATWLSGGAADSVGAAGGLEPSMPPWLATLAAVAAGYLAGAGLVWAVRILGTLAFGREAMGLGDVHLLGAVGAALGWIDAAAVFFVAPFLGLAWAGIAGLLGAGVLGDRFRHLGERVRTMPYGPHLAVAAVLLVLLRPAFVEVWRTLVPPADAIEIPVRFTGFPPDVSMHPAS